MNASDITIEWDEGGCFITIDGDSIDPEYQAGCYRWRIEDPEQLYDRVKAAIGPWLREREEAFAEFKAGAHEYAVAIREDGSLRMEPDECGYDPTDPKHPTYHDRMSAIADNRDAFDFFSEEDR